MIWRQQAYFEGNVESINRFCIIILRLASKHIFQWDSACYIALIKNRGSLVGQGQNHYVLFCLCYRLDYDIYKNIIILFKMAKDAIKQLASNDVILLAVREAYPRIPDLMLGLSQCKTSLGSLVLGIMGYSKFSLLSKQP